MLRSLMSGVSGVRGHQTYLDVIGNNIANVNTAGYKRSNLTFQDLMYQTSRGATPPMDNSGGVNAQQIGLGVQVSAIESVHTQGNTQFTGSRTDMAIQGDGYYVVLDGNSRLYTRAGNYTLDSESRLVQAGTGYKLQGFEMVPDPNDPTSFNQNSSLSDITISVGEKMEARATTIVGYRCNLKSDADAYLPMGLMANNFAATAKLAGQKYDVTMTEGTEADSFMSLNIGSETLVLKMTGVDLANGRPMLGAETPFEIAGNTYTVAFDSATGMLSLKNLGDATDVWNLNIAEQMDYQTFSVPDGANNYAYLAEFTDINTVSQPGYRTLRLWGTDYKGDMESFDYTVKVNHDGTFEIPSPAEDGTTRLGGFGGGAFVSIETAGNGRAIALTSCKEIVDSAQIIESMGIKPTILQSQTIGGSSKSYDVTITEGNPGATGFIRLKFVDRENPNNTGTLELRYTGLDAAGRPLFATSSDFNLDANSYDRVSYDPVTGRLSVGRSSQAPGNEDWSYAGLGDLVKMGSASFSGALNGTFRTEYDSVGGGDYKFTILGQGTAATPDRFLEVNASNFRQYMGVVSGTERVTIGGSAYDVTSSEGSDSASFMTLEFRNVEDGTTSTVSFAMAGLDAQNRLRIRAVSDLTLPDGTVYDRSQISYNAATGKIAFDNGVAAQTFSTTTGKYINFQVVQDNLGNKLVVDFDEAGSTAFTMKTWVPGSAFNYATAAGNVYEFTTTPGTLVPAVVVPANPSFPTGGLPLTPGTLEFEAGTERYRDDGSGGIEQYWTGSATLDAGWYAVNGTVNYRTGAIAGLTNGTENPAGTWDPRPAIFQAGNLNSLTAVKQASTYTPNTVENYSLTGAPIGTPIPLAGLPIKPGTISFTDGTDDFRDNGTGGFQRWDATLATPAWVDVIGATIDYETGAFAGLGVGPTSWSSRRDASAVAVTAAGTAQVPTAGLPIVPGSVSFTGYNAAAPSVPVQYRDFDGEIQWNSAGTWTTIVGSTINYATGAITGVTNLQPLSNITNWSSSVQTSATSSVTIPVVKGNEQTLGTANQRTGQVHNTKLDVYDSLGNPHTLEVSWEKQDSGTWRWRAWLPNSDVSIENNTGLIRFDSDGKLDTSDVTNFNTVPTLSIAFGEIGASNMAVKLDFSGQSFGKDGIEGVTQYGSPFTTKGYYQDGYEMGVMTDFAVGKDGTITGVYSNGQNVPLYRVALALFDNPAGLVKNGDTSFRESTNSGLAQIESPQQGGAGSIIGSTLEMSNVDLTEEFTKLITAQRGFQANARMITTSDQVLEELINIKR